MVAHAYDSIVALATPRFEKAGPFDLTVCGFSELAE